MNELNERIEQLAEEADEYAEQTVHYYQGQFDGLTWEGKIKQTRDTKFAELIVQICANIVRNTYLDSYSEACLQVMAEELEEHFRAEP